MAQARNYTNWHTLFPGSGQGKAFPWLLHTLRTLRPQTVLDYGCGKGGTARYIQQHVNLNVDCYDPGYAPYSTPPQGPYEMVYTTDVMEHIEREDVDSTIQHIQSLTTNFHAHIIDLDPARKRLPDGRNAHVTLLSDDEWCDTFNQWSEVVHRETEAYPDRYLTQGRRRLHIVCLKR